MYLYRRSGFGLAALMMSAIPAAAQSPQADPVSEADLEASVQEPAPGPVIPAEATDVFQGIEVRDPQGGLVGIVESVDSQGAVVTTGEVRARLPFQSFGRNELGLVISIGKSEFEAAARSKDPA